MTDETKQETPGGGGDGAAEAAAPDDGEGVEARIREALRAVKDPELGVNIVDLGLVYGIEVDEGRAKVTMTLTSPGCPAGGQILSGAEQQALSADGVDDVEIDLVWKPFWTPDKIDPKVRAALGF